MSIIRLDTLDDARLRVFSRMTDAELRDPKQLVGLHLACGINTSDEGLFIAESRNVISRAMDSGLMPFAFLTDERWVAQACELLQRTMTAGASATAEGRDCVGDLTAAADKNQTVAAAGPKECSGDLSGAADIPLFVGTRAQIQELTGFERTRGPLAAFHRPAAPALPDLLHGARRIAILEDITNFTNIGAIFRSAAALGMDAVLVTPGCHDPLYRRAARVSMGTVFQVPWARTGQETNWAAGTVPLLHELGFMVAAMALEEDSISLRDERIAKAEKLAVVLGTEGEGLRAETIAACDFTAMIPMAHGVDSLNVGAAAAIAFWETAAQA